MTIPNEYTWGNGIYLEEEAKETWKQIVNSDKKVLYGFKISTSSTDDHCENEIFIFEDGSMRVFQEKNFHGEIETIKKSTPPNEKFASEIKELFLINKKQIENNPFNKIYVTFGNTYQIQDKIFSLFYFNGFYTTQVDNDEVYNARNFIKNITNQLKDIIFKYYPNEIIWERIY